jgi:hypothetical protein
MDVRDDQFDSSVARNASGRKLVDCLAELGNAEPLQPDALATGGSVQDVLARAAVSVPFASEAERRRRRIRRTVVAIGLSGLAGVAAATAWLLPGMLTPPAERTGLTTVVSAAEQDLSEAVRTLQSVRFTQVLSATAQPRMTRAVNDLAQSAEVLVGAPVARSTATSGTPADARAEVPPRKKANVEPSAVTAASGLGSVTGGTPLASPVDEPPLEVPH